MDKTHLLTLKLVLFVKKKQTNNYNTFETGAIFNIWTELETTLSQGKHSPASCASELPSVLPRGEVTFEL